MEEKFKSLRKRLLNWHYKKARSISIIDLLESAYQCFRGKVNHRVGEDLDFREAIKRANYDELCFLQNIRDEKRIGI